MFSISMPSITLLYQFGEDMIKDKQMHSVGDKGQHNIASYFYTIFRKLMFFWHWDQHHGMV